MVRNQLEHRPPSRNKTYVLLGFRQPQKFQVMFTLDSNFTAANAFEFLTCPL
jgi:hypothetical protein